MDESRLASNGVVLFIGPNDTARFEIIVNATRTDTSIDTLRDRLAQAAVQGCARSGVERTSYETTSDVKFALLVETCDIKGGHQATYQFEAGLRNGYLWAIQMFGDSRFFNRTACSCAAGDYEQYFAPMLASLNIYGDPG